jgi:hypothetical protein
MKVARLLDRRIASLKVSGEIPTAAYTGDPYAEAERNGFFTTDAVIASFFSIYDQIFGDGGPDGKGFDKTYFTGRPEQDDALAIYTRDFGRN